MEKTFDAQEIADFFTFMSQQNEKFKEAFELMEEGKFLFREIITSASTSGYQKHEFDKVYVAPFSEGPYFILRGILDQNGKGTSFSEHELKIDELLIFDKWVEYHKKEITKLKETFDK